MGTLAQKACNGVIEIGPTPTNLVEIRSWSYDQQGAELRFDTMGACDGTTKAGRVDRRIEATLYLADPDDAAQDLIVPGSEGVEIEAFPFGKTSGKLSLIGTMNILTRTESGDVDGGVELAFTASCPDTGGLTRGTVA